MNNKIVAISLLSCLLTFNKIQADAFYDQGQAIMNNIHNWESKSEKLVADIKQHVADGKDINEKNNQGKSWLHQAEDKETAEFLIKNGQTPAHLAAQDWGNVEILDLLTTHNADINITDNNNRTPLGIAIIQYSPFSRKTIDPIKLLAENGAKVTDEHISDARNNVTMYDYLPSAEDKALEIINFLIQAAKSQK